MSGPEKSISRWRLFFYVAAAFNFAIGVPGLCADNSDVRVTSLLVVCFGLLYGIIGRDPVRFGPTLWAGVAGKAGVVALLAPSVIAGTGQPGLGLALAGDALFMVGFLIFLLRR